MAGPKPAPKKPALKIVDAKYGTDGEVTDVAKGLSAHVKAGKCEVVVLPEHLGCVDPAPGRPKVLTVVYETKGRTDTRVARDGETLTLP